jgi:carbonic anhydrase/acetyltransferase-like protein (isoleucine patch superfamily)
MASKKYKLLPAEQVVYSDSHILKPVYLDLYRIQALRDIRSIGVKKGDLGGYVSNGNILSQEGDCWIGSNAKVVGHVMVQGNAYITGNAVVYCRFSKSSITIKDKCFITGNAEIVNFDKGQDSSDYGLYMMFEGSVTVNEYARVKNLTKAAGHVRISNHAYVENATLIEGYSQILEYAHIKADVQIMGNSLVSDKCVVHEGAKLISCNVTEDAQIGARQVFTDREFYDRGLYMNEEKTLPEFSVNLEGEFTPKTPVASKSQESPTSILFTEIQDNLASYETDIVKIIKYPAMVDQSVESTLEMTIALKKAHRLSADTSSPEFTAAVEELERKFLVAESNAIKISSSLLTEEGKKKTKDAKVMLDKAADEASTENEKKIAFTQAFKQLEGIITVPEVAIDTFRVKVGLKEIEN